MPKKKAVIKQDNKGLDDRQEKFCREYLVDFNATRAYIAAGYSKKGANVGASQVLARPNIQARVKEISEQILQETGDPVKRIIMELQLIAFGDIKDVMEWDKWNIRYKESKELGDKSRMISEITETHSASGGSRKIKLHDKARALEMLSRYHGLFKDTVKHEGEVTTKVIIKMMPNGREKISEG